MTPERWQLIQRLYAGAIAREGAERNEWLARECADALVRKEVEALLYQDSLPDAPLSEVIQRVASDLLAEQSNALIGRQVGAWRLVRLIAQGGMGAVYLAERYDGQFEQRAAVKLLNPVMLSPDALARFNSERQILARLSHPNIARLYDGGATDEGVPYLVMEYIDGVPISVYCTEHRLDTRARLELFLRLCAAVDYAHRNMIVHRDIKPSNVLVGPFGEPKLLDFGVAKLIDRDQVGTGGTVTIADMRVLTPRYASPEQLKGESITAVTDVYSLGLLLYELLSGRYPYADATDSAQALQQAILSTDPQRPSIAAGRDDGPQRAPGVTHERLSRELAGDLDNIVMMALRKEPERRYGSAAQLAQDIERYLADLPVSARAATVSYRARKFVARNRVTVAAAGAALLLLTSTVAAYTWRLERERDRAEHSAAVSQRVTQFLASLFQGSDPLENSGSKLSAIDLLERGVKDVDQLSGEPALQAELLFYMAKSYRSLGELDTSIDLLRRALDLNRADPTASPRTRADILMEFGEALRQRHDLGEAEAVHREVVSIRERELGEEHPHFVTALVRLGNVLYDLDRNPEAIVVLRRALAIKEARGEVDDTDMADVLNNLGNALHANGQLAEAVPVLQRAVALSRQRAGGPTPGLATTTYNLGLALDQSGRYEEAERYHRDALAMRREIVGERHWLTAHSEGALAVVLSRRGKFDEAVALAEHALDVTGEVLGEHDPNFSWKAQQLSVVKLAMGDYRGAEQAARVAVAAVSEPRSETPAALIWAETHLARALLRQERVPEARAVLQPLYERRDGLSPRIRLFIELVMAQLLTAEGSYVESERLFIETLAGLEGVYGPDNEQVAATHVEMAKLYLLTDRPPLAVDHARRAWELTRAALGETNRRTGQAAAVLAEALTRTGAEAEARKFAELADKLGTYSPSAATAE